MEGFPDFFQRSLYAVENPNESDFIVAVATQEVFLDKGTLIPTWRALKDLGLDLGEFYCFLEQDSVRWIVCTKPEVLEAIADYQKISLRSVSLFMEPIPLAAVFTGSHLHHWLHSNVYCGRCGSRLHDKVLERARACTQCTTIVYPRISPCIIVAIRKEETILLARSPHFPTGRFSLLAGFVEPGETLESAVHREVFEEVGIKVKNVRYFGSQPWPFPDSLMVGFFADYESGELNIDKKEIESAGWFTKDALPQLPPKISISRQLIDLVVRQLS